MVVVVVVGFVFVSMNPKTTNGVIMFMFNGLLLKLQVSC